MADKFYTETHEWAEMGDDGLITIGFAFHALTSLGNIVSVTLPEPGRSTAKGESCGLVEGEHAATDIRAPLPGTITEPNAGLSAEPARLNQTPETTAWFFKMRLSDPAALAELMTQAAYDEFVTTGGKPA
jgi:glycine cleavage system H protein